MNKSLLLASGLVFTTLTAVAQQLKDGYIEWPNSQTLDLYVKNWTPGQEITRTYGYGSERDTEYEWEDENFFISRVKLKPLISNPATQIYPEYTGINDKKLLFWVPCGTTNDINGCDSGSLPNGKFDSEVFSMWSYVTHWCNWTSPYGWVPGGFADAAHKHGVLVSGMAAIPWGASSGAWHTCLEGVAEFGNEAGIEKMGQFLRYHGVDGLGYNSEFRNGGSFMEGLRTVHGGAGQIYE